MTALRRQEEDRAEGAVGFQEQTSAILLDLLAEEAPLLPRRRRLHQEAEEELHLQGSDVMERPLYGVSPVPVAAYENVLRLTSASGSYSADA